MVWKGSKKLGVGKAVATDGSTFVVARYFPAGNITNQGHFQANVLPPKSWSKYSWILIFLSQNWIERYLEGQILFNVVDCMRKGLVGLDTQDLNRNLP